jgi:DNA-binding response OmpR family regulator
VTRPRVLVVEDDLNMRSLLSSHLRRNGYEVSEAGDAESVLSARESASYDLVLADIHLPGQSGVEMARQLRAGEGEAPVVFVTGDADEKLARTALSEGAAGYLLKPFEIFELDALMRTVLHPLVKRAAHGRDLSHTVSERRAMATWKAAMQRPEQVVLRTGRTTSRRLPFGVKAVAAVVCSLLASWLVGSKALDGPSVRTTASAVTTSTSSAPATVFVPLLVEP